VSRKKDTLSSPFIIIHNLFAACVAVHAAPLFIMSKEQAIASAAAEIAEVEA
jgi:hypothetical protein